MAAASLTPVLEYLAPHAARHKALLRTWVDQSSHTHDARGVGQQGQVCLYLPESNTFTSN